MFPHTTLITPSARFLPFEMVTITIFLKDTYLFEKWLTSAVPHFIARVHYDISFHFLARAWLCYDAAKILAVSNCFLSWIADEEK